MRLREIRVLRGISQRELGLRIGFDPSASSARINQYERGKNEPSFSVMRLIAAELGVPAAYFYSEDDALAQHILEFGGGGTS